MALIALVSILVTAPLIGVLAGSRAHDHLQRSVRDQQRTRHLVSATVVEKLGAALWDPDPEGSSTRSMSSRVLADWTAPDGTAQRATVLADLRSPHRGDHFTIWTDRHGRIVGRPLDSATATAHAVLAGVGMATAIAGLAEGARRLLVWRMVRRRYARWDQAWDKAGPDWGRTGTGS